MFGERHSGIYEVFLVPMVPKVVKFKNVFSYKALKAPRFIFVFLKNVQ